MSVNGCKAVVACDSFISMDITATDVFVSLTGDRRARICRRSDGNFQFVTETLLAGADELMQHWMNDWPPSGIFNRQDDAVSALRAVLPSLRLLENVKPVSFDIRIGPYPEPGC